jgi:hypothetical protein
MLQGRGGRPIDLGACRRPHRRPPAAVAAYLVPSIHLSLLQIRPSGDAARAFHRDQVEMMAA